LILWDLHYTTLSFCFSTTLYDFLSLQISIPHDGGMGCGYRASFGVTSFKSSARRCIFFHDYHYTDAVVLPFLQHFVLLSIPPLYLY
jgi:hypothetical protein